MRRTVAVFLLIFILISALGAAPALAADSSPHLAIGGVQAGAVYSVNQPFEVWAVWQNGQPEYVGGSIEYIWSPEQLTDTNVGSSTVFRSQGREDALDLFVSAELTGVGAWVVPSELTDRIGSAQVTIAGLSDARSPMVNYTEERPVPRTVSPGASFTLSAEWRNASGQQTATRPLNVRYVWTCAADDMNEQTIAANSLTASLRAMHPGVYTYTCSAYSTQTDTDDLLCSVQFPVTVSGDADHTFEISSSPASSNGIVRVPAGESAVLRAQLEPSVSGSVQYTWQSLGDTGIWEDIPEGTGAEYTIDTANLAPGTVTDYRCLGRSSDWAGATSAISVEVSDPRYAFELSPYDLSASENSSAGLRMIAVVSHAQGAEPQAEWQFRPNSSTAWNRASDAVPGFVAEEPRTLSPTLTEFAWVPTGTASAQNGEYRCVCSGTSSSAALLTITDAQNSGMQPKEPLALRTLTGVGNILTGLNAPSGAKPYTAADVCDMAGAPADLQSRAVQRTRIMLSTETAATGVQIQILNASGSVSQSATLILCGDVLGTGTMGLSQLVRLSQALREQDSMPLFGPFLEAGDFDGNHEIDLSDLVGLADLMMQENAL